MTAVSSVVLRRVERVLSARVMAWPTSLFVHSLAHTVFPVFAPDRLARAAPSSVLAQSGSDDPFVVRFERGARLDGEGPLAGESVVVKDSIDVEGAPTGLGLAGGTVALRDATIVARARAAGAFVLGKTKMTELGLDGLGGQLGPAMPRNPRAPGYFPGGSSTGTAVAVAANLARYGIGGDGMGSIRIPAAFCGLVGLKPTHDRLPSEGYPSVSPSMDVTGPLARNVADCARLWQVLAGEAPTTLTSLIPPRIGVIRTLGPALATADIARNFHDVLKRLGAVEHAVDVPLAAHSAGIGVVIATSEVATGPYGKRDVSSAGRVTLALGRALTTKGRARLAARRAALRAQTLRALDGVEFLAMPTTAVPAPAVTPTLLNGGMDGILLRAVGLYTPLANVTGLPSIAVPTGVDDRGRPLSIMFVGPPGSELELLRLALAVEQMTQARGRG